MAKPHSTNPRRRKPRRKPTRKRTNTHNTQVSPNHLAPQNRGTEPQYLDHAAEYCEYQVCFSEDSIQRQLGFPTLGQASFGACEKQYGSGYHPYQPCCCETGYDFLRPWFFCLAAPCSPRHRAVPAVTLQCHATSIERSADLKYMTQDWWVSVADSWFEDNSAKEVDETAGLESRSENRACDEMEDERKGDIGKYRDAWDCDFCGPECFCWTVGGDEREAVW